MPLVSQSGSANVSPRSAVSNTPPPAHSSSAPTSSAVTPRQPAAVPTLSGAKLEEAKNHALLFFMDHLMSKPGSRTIHDLSCQFGARNFTPEMREAVGNTQEGLSDFLGSYPSLFNVDGDTVCIAYGDMLGPSQAAPLLQNFAKDRDYEREAIEFFEKKLNKFGPEMQIKSLLGHRSQAAPEIRLVSGRHVKDFTDFLFAHHHNFVVEGDRVRLKNMPEPDSPIDSDPAGNPLVGTKAKQTALDFLRNILEDQEIPMPMEQLYQHFCNRFSHRVRQEVATNPKELLYFLKLNRTVFFIRSNKVSLVKSRPESEGGSEDGDSGKQSMSGRDSLPESDDSRSSSGGSAYDDEASLLEMITVVSSVKAATTAVQDIVDSYGGGGEVDGDTPEAPPSSQAMERVISVDFKLVSLGELEFVALVVVGTQAGSLYIFDVAHSSSLMLESGLKQLLESDQWIKIIHDCKRISSLIYQQYEIKIQRIFDTQIANIILQHQKTSRAIHDIKPISFLTLQRMYFPQSLMYTNTNPRNRAYKRDPKFWSIRPLSAEMILLAAEEVHVLIPNIYQAMACALKPENDSLFRHMCQEQVDYYIKRSSNGRRDKRKNFVMTLINDKLSRDPTGQCLSLREKQVLRTDNNLLTERSSTVNAENSSDNPILSTLPHLLPTTVSAPKQPFMPTNSNGLVSPGISGTVPRFPSTTATMPNGPAPLFTTATNNSATASLLPTAPRHNSPNAFSLPLQRHPFPPPPQLFRPGLPFPFGPLPNGATQPGGHALAFPPLFGAHLPGLHQQMLTAISHNLQQQHQQQQQQQQQQLGGRGILPCSMCVCHGVGGPNNPMGALRRARSFIKPKTAEATTQTSCTGEIQPQLSPTTPFQ